MLGTTDRSSLLSRWAIAVPMTFCTSILGLNWVASTSGAQGAVVLVVTSLLLLLMDDFEICRCIFVCPSMYLSHVGQQCMYQRNNIQDTVHIIAPYHSILP